MAQSSLESHELRFHKKSTDGTGKADAYLTHDPSDKVLGVIYKIEEAEFVDLDRAEQGYDRSPEGFTITLDGKAERVQAWIYRALPENIDPHLKPARQYLEYVIKGAEEHGLPPEYVAHLRAEPVIEDDSGG